MLTSEISELARDMVLSTLGDEPEGPRQTVAFSRDGNEVYLASAQGKAWRLDLRTKVQSGLPFKVAATAVQKPVTALAFAPGGSYFAWADASQKIKRLDLIHERSNQVQMPLFLTGHCADIDVLTFSADGKWLASGDASGEVRVWGEEDGKVIARRLPELIKGVRALAFSPDGTQLVTGGTDGWLRRWDWRSCQEMKPAR